MKNTIKVLAKKSLHQGYFDLYQYDLKIPSLAEKNKSIFHEKRELLQTPDSVLVLLYAPSTDHFVFCEEFRIGIQFNADAHNNPFLIQCVAGTIENDEQPQETAVKEVQEETGIVVDKLERITSVYKSPGILTEKSYLYYGEIVGEPKAGIYGIGSEEIKTHLISRKEVYHRMDNEQIHDAATLIALQWFRLYQNP